MIIFNSLFREKSLYNLKFLCICELLRSLMYISVAYDVINAINISEDGTRANILTTISMFIRPVVAANSNLKHTLSSVDFSLEILIRRMAIVVVMFILYLILTCKCSALCLATNW